MEPRIISSLGDGIIRFYYIKKKRGKKYGNHPACEVKEETGLDVTNITYFGNQAWPYPSGLMVGFIADYAGGEIRLQEEELSSGDFYTRDNLPELPRKLSLARKMIDWWLECSHK